MPATVLCAMWVSTHMYCSQQSSEGATVLIPTLQTKKLRQALIKQRLTANRAMTGPPGPCLYLLRVLPLNINRLSETCAYTGVTAATFEMVYFEREWVANSLICVPSCKARGVHKIKDTCDSLDSIILQRLVDLKRQTYLVWDIRFNWKY